MMPLSRLLLLCSLVSAVCVSGAETEFQDSDTSVETRWTLTIVISVLLLIAVLICVFAFYCCGKWCPDWCCCCRAELDENKPSPERARLIPKAVVIHALKHNQPQPQDLPDEILDQIIPTTGSDDTGKENEPTPAPASSHPKVQRAPAFDIETEPTCPPRKNST